MNTKLISREAAAAAWVAYKQLLEERRKQGYLDIGTRMFLGDLGKYLDRHFDATQLDTDWDWSVFFRIIGWALFGTVCGLITAFLIDGLTN